LHGLLVDIDETTGKALFVRRIAELHKIGAETEMANLRP
jgi:hypothetical protein